MGMGHVVIYNRSACLYISKGWNMELCQNDRVFQDVEV
jgi:hypothetical protein